MGNSQILASVIMNDSPNHGEGIAFLVCALGAVIGMFFLFKYDFGVGALLALICGIAFAAIGFISLTNYDHFNAKISTSNLAGAIEEESGIQNARSSEKGVDYNDLCSTLTGDSPEYTGIKNNKKITFLVNVKNCTTDKEKVEIAYMDS